MSADDELAPLYRAALAEHMAGAGESALLQAYTLGRTALAEGLGVVDLVLLHHAALSDVLSARPADTHGELALATGFLAECLAPFEMMQRGYQETNARLSASNANLMAANAATAAANEALKAEVAERERAEAALVHAQKLQAVGLLAGGVAHHFNNLLTVVLGNLHLARRRAKTGEDIERYLLAAADGAERGAQVVKQLLTFSRQQVLKTQIVDVSHWMAAASPLLVSALRGDIAVDIEVEPAVWPIRIDPAQLELALLNLAVNARDAMPDGGVLRISASNRHMEDDRLGLHGDYVMIAVSDTGEGVDPDIAPRVFEPFFTTKPLGPGAGLGLSQVHGFIHQSGGAIDLESLVEQGATFRVYLPAEPQAAPTDAEPAAVRRRHVDAAGRVLIVDDDVDVADLVGQLLQGCGYAVTHAHRAKAALDLLIAGEPVDLVFSDILMPGGMNGVQLAEEVRRRFPKVPVLLATGYSEVMSEATAKGLPVITKPYDSDDLCERVSQLMGAGRR
jgi:signal transduction histidine kinase